MIPRAEVENACTSVSRLGDSQYFYSRQFRRNIQYKDIEISLKYSERWGFHVEFEKLVETQSEVAAAETTIMRVAGELGIKLLTHPEEKALEDKLIAGLSLGAYSEQEFSVQF